MRDLALDLESMSRAPATQALGAGARMGVTWRATATGATAVLLVLAAAVAVWFARSAPPGGAGAVPIRSLAVLPLRSLASDADPLGLGLADTIITRVSQTGQLTVRPTSAVRRFVTQEVDGLAAARQLGVDAVLEGTLQRSGDRLRVSVNLLRLSDGASLWADTFDATLNDIFDVQDQVSRAIASQLRLGLDAAQEARLIKRDTSSVGAYDYYTKALSYFDDRGFSAQEREPSDRAAALLEKAVELDPGYARAHAQLAYAYAWTAVFSETNPRLIERAKHEMAMADQLDPRLPITHVVRSFVVWSQYEGWQVEAAVRELKSAQRLDPSVGHSELGTLYAHIGLEEQSTKEAELALAADPTSEITKSDYVNMTFLNGRPDEGQRLQERFGRRVDFRYYVQKQMADEAMPLIQEALKLNPTNGFSRLALALGLALQGRHREAQAEVSEVLSKAQRNRAYHHLTYDIARVFALAGQKNETLKWLQATVEEGFPCHPLFLRDRYLDSLRSDPGFIALMAQSKTRLDRYQGEFR